MNVNMCPNAKCAKRAAWLNRTALATALASGLFLSACSQSAHHQEYASASAEPATYRERHPIVLARRERILDIPVAAKGAHLSAEARDEILRFEREFADSDSRLLTLARPKGSKNEKEARRIADEILRILSSADSADSGADSGRVKTALYDAKENRGGDRGGDGGGDRGGDGGGAPVRLSYRALTAEVGACGEWGNLADTSRNENAPNFGCATQTNLAAMLQEPKDLIVPRATTGIDAVRRSRVIGDYRTATEPNTPDQTYGTISSVYE